MKKSLKIALIIIISLLVIILIFNFSFGYLIKSQISNFTNKSITLKYESSSARLFTGSIEFNNAVLHFNDISIDSSSSIFIEGVAFDKFAIKRLSLKALFFDRSFNIEKVLLSGPSFDFLRDTNIQPRDIFSKILTPEVVSDKSKSAPFDFEIDELEIEQGSFQLMEATRSDLSLGSINLKLSDISMDDLKVLNGDSPDLNAQFNIRLGIYDLHKELNEGAVLLIDSIIYKKDKKQWQTGGIKLSNLRSSTNFATSKLSIFTDLVSVEGFSLSHLLSSKDLKFNTLTIANTEINETLEYFTEKKISEEESASKFQVISTMFNAFLTDTFHIQNLNYRSINLTTDTVDYIDNLNLWVYSIRVDSNFILEEEYMKPIERSTLLSGPFSMHMPEIGIDVSCDTLIYSGPGTEKLITNLQLKKYPSLFSDAVDQPSFRFVADSLLIWGLDERELIDSSVVELSGYLQNPRLFGSNVNFEKSENYSSQGIIPKKIVLNQLNLINGNIDIQGSLKEIVAVEKFNIEAIDLEIFSNSNQSDKKVDWQSIDISIENSKFDIAQKLLLQVDKGSIVNNDLDFEGILFSEVHDVQNFDDRSKMLPDTTRLFTQGIEIDNFDIEAFINRKHLSIDKLAITKPEYFQYTSLKQKKQSDSDSVSPMLLYKRINQMLPSYFSYINIKDFSISKAEVKYQLEQNNMLINAHNSLLMHNILFDQELPEGESPELTIDRYEFCVSDVKVESDMFQYQSESICYNSIDDNLTMVNSQAASIATKDVANNSKTIHFDVNFPWIELTQPDFTPLSGGPLSFNLLHLNDPEINIYIPTNQKQNKQVKKDKSILPFAYLEDGISLEYGKISVCLLGETDSTFISIDEIGAEIHEIFKIVGDENQHSGSRNLFSYLDFNLNDISMNGPGMELNIGTVSYNKQLGIFSIDPIKYKMFSKPGKTEFESVIEIPVVRIEQPDVMIENERIKSFGAVNLLMPAVNVAHQSAKKEQPQEIDKINLSVNDRALRNFLGKVDFVHLDSTVLNNISFSQRTLSDSSGGSFDIERVSLLVDKLKIDSSHFDFHKKRIAKDIVLQLYDREIVSADSMYDFKVSNVIYYYSRDKVVIDSFEVIPRYERKEFFKKATLQTDRMQVKFNRAVAEGIDLISILESKKLQVNKLTLDKFHLMDHRDQHYPRKENDFKKLPKEALFGLPFLLDLDTVEINNSFLLYGEYVDKSPEPGEIYFTNFNASIYNLSNIPPTVDTQDSIFAQITTDIMDVSKMTVDLTIPLNKNNASFWIRGGVEKVDLRKFNSMTENLFGISVVRGKGGLDIPLITFSDTTSQGSITFRYDKLKLALYNRNKAKLSRGLGSGLIDFMLNGVLIKSNNPTFLGKTRIGDVFAKRNNERSFFNYVWKSTNSGLMATMGFYSKDQREEKKERKVEEKIERKDERQLYKMNK